ncbi:NADH-quinone oxidoreductase subunit N [bacterium BMS3Bbin12]|nr:NADH-quinone oxidoreductase subunit N [bacterium BMS3Abin12]GBE49063.1 NADH-quinone oxidoreductase subunit N [bacterium BMS3Bbin12]GBE51322.1 NADH-quinone oxidoreductase subunit N [bacterium BMS3Bbin13]
MTSMAHDLSFLIPEILVLLTGAGTLVCEMLRRPRTALAVAVAGLLLATALTLPLLGVDTSVFSGTFRIDTLSIWAKLILLPATVLSLLLARAELHGGDREGTVYSLLCFTTFGALVLAGSGDTMFLVLGVLLSGLGAFALVAYPRNDAATEAAMKFFVFASVTGGVMIFGLTYWFGATGSTLLGDLGGLDKAPLAAAVGLIAVIVGLGYKASLVPFHFWAPDAYEGAPLSVAAYLSVVPKIGAIFALVQVVRDLPVSGGWPFLLAVVSVLTMTFGYLAALVQDNVVRLLAYSSIAQAGYFLLGVVAVGVSPLALPALIVFAAAYAAMNLGAFSVTLRTGRTLDAFAGLGRGNPVVGVAMVLFLLSLTGIPPLAGFVGKFLLFGAAIDAHFTWLTVVAILNSVLSLAVYLRIVVPMYRRRSEAAAPMPTHLPWNRAVWVVALIATLAIGLGAQALIGRLA